VKVGDRMSHFEGYSDVNIVRCDRIHPTFIANFQRQLKNIPKMKEKKFLSFGCGMGHELEAAKALGCDVTGIDIDSTLVKKLKHFKVVIYDGKKMPFKENSFDIISMNMVLEHLFPDQAQDACKGIYRVLKPGGYFMIITPHPRQQTAKFSNFWADQTHIRPYHRAAIENLLKSVGFKIYRSYDFVSTVPGARKILTSMKLYGLYYALIPVFNGLKIGTLDECVIGKK
jgi:ubiquinone/menaquinone biosynthesis C-methylase UbiE